MNEVNLNSYFLITVLPYYLIPFLKEEIMQLKIITHERIIFEGEADEIVIQAQTGQIGVLKDHIPFTTVLEVGVTKIRQGEKIRYFATMGGVFQFKDNIATILTDVCEDGCDIDVTRANDAKSRAEARLADADAKIDSQRAQAALARSLARLKAALNK
jgi:F-type H+-transporting ATPase subunit epsilon